MYQIAVQSAGCIFADFFSEHKHNFWLSFRSFFKSTKRPHPQFGTPTVIKNHENGPCN